MSKTEKKEVQLPKRSFVAEFWVGVFALLGILAFGYLSINLGGMRFNSAGYYKLIAEFSNISGLKVGAPVEIAGVRIGEVTNIELADTSARVHLEIEKTVPLRDDDIAQIRTKGIIGDKYVKISPGGSPEILTNGAELMDTESAVEFEDIIGKFIHSLDSE